MGVLTPLVRAAARTFTSSTFLSGLVSIAAGAVAQHNGWDVPPAVQAAIPLAVGWKEAVRRRGEVDLERAKIESDDNASFREHEKAQSERARRRRR